MTSQTVIPRSCQCLAPDYANTLDEHGWETRIHLPKEETILHGRKATTECIVCGCGLCYKCEVNQLEKMFTPEELEYNSFIPGWEKEARSNLGHLCPNCAKEEE